MAPRKKVLAVDTLVRDPDTQEIHFLRTGTTPDKRFKDLISPDHFVNPSELEKSEDEETVVSTPTPAVIQQKVETDPASISEVEVGNGEPEHDFGTE